MNAVLNAQPDQRSPEWYANRVGRITASRVGAILGLSKYRTRDDVMRDMVREALGAPREFVSNEATEYGQAHEADALAEYEQRFAVMVEPSPLVVHPDHDWLAASPDGLVGDHGLIECKAPFRARYTKPSDEYVAQMQLQMACTGRDWTDFVIWREGEPIIVDRVDRDPDWLSRNLDALQVFIGDYAENIASSKLAAPYLADKERDDAEWAQACSEYIAATRDADEAARIQKLARERLVSLAPQGAKGCGLQLIRAERAGAIAYAKAIKQMLPDADLEPFRGAPSTTYSVRIA